MAALSLVQPRPGIQRPKSGVPDLPDGYSRSMIRWRDQIMDQARTELEASMEIREAERYIDYLSGNWWDQNRPAYRSRFYDNHMADVRRESLAALTDIKPTIDVRSKVDAYKDRARAYHNYVRHVWYGQDLDLKLARLVDHALFGTGFLKIVADFPGVFRFTEHGADQVMPVFMESDDLQTSAAVAYRTYKGLGYFLNTFGPDKCKGLERQSVGLARGLSNSDRLARPDSVPEYTWNVMSPAMKRHMAMRRGPTRAAAGSISPFPVIELIEIYSDDWSINEHDSPVIVQNPDLSVEDHNYWYEVPQGCRLFPRKRLTVFAGDRVMYDGPAPFWHGLYPFVMLQLNPCVWAPGGISKYRDLVPLVRSLNRIGAGVDESVMRALNGTWITKRGAINDTAWDMFQPGKPGQKIMLNPIANPATDFMEKQAPSLPGQVEMFMRYVVDTIKRRSGVVDVQGMMRKKQMPGGDAVEQMRDAQSGPFRLEGRYVESALRRGGYLLLSDIIQYAPLQTRIAVLGSDGITMNDFDYSPGEIPWGTPREDYWKHFAMDIVPGSSHGNSKAQVQNRALVVAAQGKLSMRTLFEILELPVNYDEELARIKSEHDAGIGVAPPKGRTPRMTRGQRNGSPA